MEVGNAPHHRAESTRDAMGPEEMDVEQNIDRFVELFAEPFLETIQFFLSDPEPFCEGLGPGSPGTVTGVLRRKSFDDFSVSVEPTQFANMVKQRHNLDFVPYTLAMLAFERAASEYVTPRALAGPLGVYSLNSDLLSLWVENKTLGGLMFGYRYFCTTMRSSVLEVSAETAVGDQHTGSGFVTFFNDGALRCMTCRHNVLAEDGTPYKNVRLASAAGTFTATGGQALSRADIAILDFEPKFTLTELRFKQGNLLEPLISAGYPRIHLLERSPLLFHHGHLNGWTGKIEDGTRSMVTSCDVAPGSSGGPLVNGSGQCVGVIYRRVETESQEGMARYSLAVPMEQIKSELDAGRADTFDL